jgi:hypothetical protein
MTTVDIFIKTYHKDFIWLEYLLKSIKKFASGFRKIIIVSDDDGNMLPEHFKDIIDFTVIYAPLPIINDRCICHGVGYIWQQCIKLSWYKYTDANEVVIFDSDEMLSLPTTPDSFKTNGKFNWYYRKWEEAGNAICHKHPVDTFLKMNTPYESMCITGFYFTFSATKALEEHLNNIYKTYDIFSIVNICKLTNLSEFNIFGNFIYSIQHPDYNYLFNTNKAFNKSIIKSWSWGGLKEEDKNKRLIILRLSE